MLSTPEQEVFIEVDHVDAFEFDVAHDFKPTHITIQNTSTSPQTTPDVILAGLVNNPIGMTDVFAARGDIFSTPPIVTGPILIPGGLVRTDSFRLEAVAGSIGLDDLLRLRLQIVESDDGPTAAADRYRTADAGGDVFMEVRGLLRRALVGNEPTTGFVVDVERVRSGTGGTGDVNLEYLNGLLQPTVIPGPYQIEVHEPDVVDTPANAPGPPPRTTVVTDHFRVSPGATPTVFPRGVWGAGSTPVDVDYVTGVPLDPDRRMISAGDIDIVGITSSAAFSAFIAVTAFTDVLADGNIDVLTNGHITLTEEEGDLRAGLIASIARNVDLTSRKRDIIDAPADQAADVQGVNLTFAAPLGRVGTFENPLEINSSVPATGVVKADALSDIVLIEIGTLNVDRIRSEFGDVSLFALDGSILDFFDDVDADVIGVNQFLRTTGGAIGDKANDLDIDSSTVRPGRLAATSSGSIFITETDSSLNVQSALSPGGDIRLTVPDTAATDEDLILMEGGFIFTNEVDITLQVGDDVDTRLESAMFAASDIFIFGDFGDADPGVGTRIVLRGATRGDLVGVAGNADDDEVRIENGALNTAIVTFDGDDLIFGSDAGTDDPDFTDTIRFGDAIAAGPGDDRVFGLGGGDRIDGGSGDDEIDGGAHGDLINGDDGDDALRGGFGDDEIHGGAGVDNIDGGLGGDRLFGEDGDDQVSAGGGTGNSLDGGAGDDVLKGSDEGTDTVLGAAGRDYLFGFAGNDALDGGIDDDILDGGAGDDVLQGGAGTDVLVGGADHDIVLGDDFAFGDDNAVDYLYGDFGTNLNEPGSGGDRLFGQGGNDLEFGEGADDAIFDPFGASNLIDAGAGDDPAVFIPPPPTPNPVPAVTPDDPLAVNTLPSGPAYGGWWAEIAGSATGFGLSGGVGAALDTTVASDASGVRYVAWSDTRNGNYEIYVARESAIGWEMLGGSAAGGGVSDSQADSRRPALLIHNGRPTVAWTEVNDLLTDIRVAQYDAATDTWVALDTSLAPGGISNTERADQAQIVEADGRILVTWLDSPSDSGQTQVYARTFDGANWIEITPGSASGGGITQSRLPVSEYDVAAEGGHIAVAWSAGSGDEVDVYARVREGAAWVDIGGSTVGRGVSNSVTESREPDVAWLNGQPFIAYRERIGDIEQIYVKTFVGGAWESAGPDGAVKQGVSNTTRRSLDPKLEAGGGQLFLAWVDHDHADYADPHARIYAKRWDGTAFVETLPGDASGGGISATGGKLSSLALSVDANGRPSVAWTDDSSGLPQAFLRTVTQLPGKVFVANDTLTVQAILDANDLGAGDVIVLAPGVHAGFGLAADDEGVLVLGAQGGGSVVSGAVVANAGGVLQRLNLAAGVTVGGANGLALVDNTIGGNGLTIDGASALQVLHNRFNGPTTGITIAAAAEGLIAHNDVFAAETGLAIDAQFKGDIRDNDFRNAKLGVRYGASAPLNGNRIHDNDLGVRATVGGTTDALGFLPASAPNEISGNLVGLELAAAEVQNQHVFGNDRGVTGNGILGGSDLDHANVIESNTVGVARFDGTIRFNKIGANKLGIDAATGNVIESNFIYRNGQAGVLAEGVKGVHITDNTMYTPSGDLVRVVGNSADVEVLRNTLWTENGYDLFIANDSQTGFFSDFNNLYATGAGKVGFWTRDFFDVLDWQADIARFDLNSFGATVVNPEWARPRFVNLHDDDYSLFPMFGTQRFSSPGAAPAAGVPHIALRYPDLYVDAIQDKPLTIRWESFSNTAASPVKIDLYQDTPDGPALVTTIVAATPDDGEFVWTPAASGIGLGTHGLRIQVSWAANPLVLDRSQETFTVPEGGADFFVDDASNTGDEYTPAAVGSNRNTGKLATAPKPYPTNLLRVYDLTEGARLFVDTGSYSMIDPVAVSGSIDLGLGLDQGFVITGPTNPVAVAELFPAIPGDRARALVELNDADSVEVAHLTLRDAGRGLYAHNDSTEVAAHDVTAFGHALEGIRVETKAPESDFDRLVAHDNGAHGIYVDGQISSLTSSTAFKNAAGGIYLNGGVEEVRGNVARDNGGYGFEIRDPGPAVIQRNSSFGNVRGMLIDNPVGGEAALAGAKDLAPGTANLIYRNDLGGAEASHNVVFAGNTVATQTGASCARPHGCRRRGRALQRRVREPHRHHRDQGDGAREPRLRERRPRRPRRGLARRRERRVLQPDRRPPVGRRPDRAQQPDLRQRHGRPRRDRRERSPARQQHAVRAERRRVAHRERVAERAPAQQHPLGAERLRGIGGAGFAGGIRVGYQHLLPHLPRHRPCGLF